MTQAAPTAIVLGGSAGVGRAVVDRLVTEGYAVGVVARDPDRLRLIEHEYEAGQVSATPADVADAAALAAAVETLVARLGPPEVWVNVAMVTVYAPFDQMTPEEFERVIDVTFLGQVNGTREALRHMKRGNIVNIGSGLAYRPIPIQSAYCAAKHAINGFTGAVRSEVLRAGRPIALSLVQLPAVNTPQFDWARNKMSQKPQPAPPIYQPEVVAEAVMKAIRTDARELLIGVSTLKMLFGQATLPGWLDWKMAREGPGMQKSGEPEPGGRPDNLMTPVSLPPNARGRFGDGARDSGLIVDAGVVRKAIYGGGLVAVFLLGLLLG